MARIAITGATGFVGSNIAELLANRGHAVSGLLRKPPQEDLPWPHREVDFSSPHSIADALAGSDAVVHCAIANDFHMLLNDRPGAYDAYVGMTSRVAQAAHAAGTHMVYISTDWVMDGLRRLSPETDCGNPVNIYGFLKAMGEQVVRDVSGQAGAICRIGGVMGSHRLQASGPRSQDVGFGYFVVSLVQSLQRGERFAVWGGPFVNAYATPSLASEIGAEVERVISLRATGTFHLVGDDAVGRMELARLVCEVFALDQQLLDSVDAPTDQLFPQAVPVDTSLSNAATKAALGLAPTSLRALLVAFRQELATGKLGPLTN